MRKPQVTLHSVVKDSFPLKIRNKTRIPAYTTAIQHCTVNSSQSNKTKEIAFVMERKKQNQLC